MITEDLEEESGTEVNNIIHLLLSKMYWQITDDAAKKSDRYLSNAKEYDTDDKT